MSRTEELRAKLRQKNEYDPLFSEFNVKVERFLNDDRAASAGSTKFMKELYEQYKRENPGDLRIWLQQKLLGKFASRSSKPIWRYEAEWCFLDDEPMEFLHQFDTEYSTMYIFEGRRESSEGFLRVIKMKEQDENGSVRIEGELIG